MSYCASPESPEVEEMISIQQALHLQLTRLASVLEAQTEAKASETHWTHGPSFCAFKLEYDWLLDSVG